MPLGNAARLLSGNGRLVIALIAACTALWAVFLLMTPQDVGRSAPGILGSLCTPSTGAWSVGEIAAVFAMWAVMMAAMMLPSAMPMIVNFAALDRRTAAAEGHTAGFVAAYLVVWAGFSAGASVLQWWLQSLGLISALGAATAGWFAGALFLVAGAFQFSELKQACLRKCRTPLGFLMTEWRAGARGAAMMGLRHGVFCLGCCWALMLLPFVAGTMNIAWMAVLTAIVAVEKVAPYGDAVSRAIGAALLGIGVTTLGMAIL